MKRGWMLLLGGIGLLAALVAALAWLFPQALEGEDAWMRLVHATVLLSVFLIPSLMYRNIRLSQAMKAAAIWGGLGLVLFVGYAFRDEMASVYHRLAGELIPGAARESGAAMQVRVGRDGHFQLTADVDGVAVQFLVDTGASNVVLSPSDARRLGFDLEKLDYSKTFQTANGTVQGAPVTLGQITIGSIQMKDVRASVNGADMGRSLLGMSFLRRLSRFEMDANSLTLTP